MLNLILSILVFISVVLILVTFHEFGHFSVAKLFGIRVQRFSVGFGKPFFSFYDKTGTEYALAPIPLGGYVKLLDSREEETPLKPDELPYAFDHRPLYQRFAVVAAGPLFNIIFAILGFWLVLMIGVVTVKPIIGTITPNSPAAKSGIHTGDQLLSINAQKTSSWSAVALTLILHYGEKGPLTFTVQRGSSNQPIPLKLDLSTWHLDALKPDPLGSLGIAPYIPEGLRHNASGKVQLPANMLTEIRYPPLQAFGAAVNETYFFAKMNLVMLYKMLTGVISWRGLGGPISIMQAAEVAALQGLVIYLNFLAFLSISIAIVNLLPIPGLDGSQLFYQLIELVLRRPVSVEMQIMAFRIGFIIFLLLIVQVFVNDLLRLLG